MNMDRWTAFRLGALGEVRAQLARDGLAPRPRVGAVMQVLRDRLALGRNQGLFTQEGPVTDETLSDIEEALRELALKGDTPAMEGIAMTFLDRYFIGLDKAISGGSQRTPASA